MEDECRKMGSVENGVVNVADENIIVAYGKYGRSWQFQAQGPAAKKYSF